MSKLVSFVLFLGAALSRVDAFSSADFKESASRSLHEETDSFKSAPTNESPKHEHAQDVTPGVNKLENKAPINALKIQSLSHAGPGFEAGWEFYFEDLNNGAGGRFIYAGYQRGDFNPVTSILFKDYGDAQVKTMPGWEWSPEDLNKGAGGQYIYMYWKRGESGKEPIMDLMFQIVEDGSPAYIPGWHQVGPDLNKGAGGRYIWAYYTTYDFRYEQHYSEEGEFKTNFPKQHGAT